MWTFMKENKSEWQACPVFLYLYHHVANLWNTLWAPCA